MREKLIPKVLKGHKVCLLKKVLWLLQNTFVSRRWRVSDIALKIHYKLQDNHYLMKWKEAGRCCITTFVIVFKLLSHEKLKLNIYPTWQTFCMNYASFIIMPKLYIWIGTVRTILVLNNTWREKSMSSSMYTLSIVRFNCHDIYITNSK